MKRRRYPPICCNSNSLHRICSPMRPNIILRSNSHHQPTLSNPLYRHKPSRMNLRGILSRQSYPNTILRFPLSPPIHHLRPSPSPPPLSPRNWIKQSNRSPIRLRYNSIPPLLHNQRHTWRTSHNPGTPNTSPILPRPPRRPR